ncbi:MAG TPA: FAD-dependent oxidoreductase [Azospirillum sp.]|nr:FAD-dependent oxidoreductase [Azospirillum sp.]
MAQVSLSDLPIAIIGAGPVGLAAAAHAARRGLTPVVFERGAAVGASLREWAHVRVFSPWRHNIDAAARALLEEAGWSAPDDDALPTGGEIVRDYLEPLAALPAIAPNLRLGAEVLAITRDGLDKLTTPGRAEAPLVVSWRDRAGVEHRTRARAVLDASGTWFSPNPMGVDGLPVPGEREAADRISYGIPDVRGAARAAYAGATVVVVGSGHSAMNAVLDLLALQDEAPGTRVLWALRRNRLARLLGGGLNDKLPARGALGIAATRAIEEGRLELLSPYAAERVDRTADGLRIAGRLGGQPHVMEVQRVVVATGLRPDLSILRELRVELDPLVEAPPKLAPLIDPNLHSCGTVPPHGVEELAHPEPGFYIVGGKSYGRAPTFLMATGYEQARSVVAEIAGDHAAARDVHLVLPETGVCSSDSLLSEEREAAGGCCGTPAPAVVPPVKVTGCCTRSA